MFNNNGIINKEEQFIKSLILSNCTYVCNYNNILMNKNNIYNI